LTLESNLGLCNQVYYILKLLIIWNQSFEIYTRLLPCSH